MKGNLVLFAVLAVALAALPAVAFQGKATGAAGGGKQAIDANNDGICDISGNPIGSGVCNGQGQQAHKGYGRGDGTGNSGQGPRDGTGWGAQKEARSGVCDGSGMGRRGANRASRAGNSSGRGGRR